MRSPLIVMNVALCFLFSAIGFAGENAPLGADQVAQLKAFYKDLHENPELSGEETRTASKVAAEFKRIGLEVTERIGGTGVVGVLKNGKGPVTMVRAELDALPVPENTGARFASRAPGKMHACGHDSHETIMLGAATALAQSKSQWQGTLIFLAQPSEEKINGALAMIKDRLFEKIPKPDYILALHTTGLVARGKVAIVTDYALANADAIEITFRGVGTHGSRPENGIDPIVEAAEFILKSQTILGREKAATKPAGMTIGSIHGGTRGNIISEEVKLQLTMRTFDPEVRSFLKKRVTEIANGIAKTNRAPSPTIAVVESTDATYNDPELSSRMKRAIERRLGPGALAETAPIMASEDFGQFAKAAKAPAMLLWLGERNPEQPDVANHSPKYLPDFEKTFELGVNATLAEILDLQQK